MSRVEFEDVAGVLSRVPPVTGDSSTWRRSFAGTMALARSYGLGSYDAAYLELAVRESSSACRPDRTLAMAAEKAGVGIYPEEREG